MQVSATIRSVNSKAARLVLSLWITLLIIGCDNNDDDDDDDDQPEETASQLMGTLVIPGDADTAEENLLLPAGMAAALRSSQCPDVPDGYAPLEGAAISFVDSDGNAVGNTTVSDECGNFDISGPDGEAELIAEADGYRPIRADVALFSERGEDIPVASTVVAEAEYRIGALQRLDEKRIAFTVTDTVSNQSVLGLPQSAISVSLDGVDSELLSLSYRATESDASTALVVLDASGSMDDTAYEDPETSELWTRQDLVSLAAHRFIEQKSAQDSVGMLIFSSYSHPLTREYIDTNLMLTDASGAGVSPGYPVSGFTDDPALLHFAVDTYNPDSDLWPDGTTSRHPSVPDDISYSGRYPFEGSTHLYEAIGNGLEMLAEVSPVRPVIVAMTDGQDTTSNSYEPVVQAAIDASTPVYTIGFSEDAEAKSLSAIADQTGGSYFQVESTDISGAFQSIQTGIVFQYIGTLSAGSNASTASRLTISLDYNGLQVDREIDLTVADGINPAN